MVLGSVTKFMTLKRGKQLRLDQILGQLRRLPRVRPIAELSASKVFSRSSVRSCVGKGRMCMGHFIVLGLTLNEY